MRKRKLEWETITIISVIVLIVILIGSMACAAIYNYQEQQLIVSGYVIDKNFNRAYTSYNRNKIGDTWIETPVYHEASYNIYIQSDDGNHKAWYEVTEYIYNQYKIGDYIKNVNRELK